MHFQVLIGRMATLQDTMGEIRSMAKMSHQERESRVNQKVEAWDKSQEGEGSLRGGSGITFMGIGAQGSGGERSGSRRARTVQETTHRNPEQGPRRAGQAIPGEGPDGHRDQTGSGRLHEGIVEVRRDVRARRVHGRLRHLHLASVQRQPPVSGSPPGPEAVTPGTHSRWQASGYYKIPGCHQ